MPETDLPLPTEESDDKKPLSAKFIKTEVNFARLPFFALSRKELKNKVKTEYRDVVERNNEKLEVLWKVTANAEYGYPTPFDKKVSKAVEYVINEGGLPIENPIGFSVYKIAELIGLKPSQKGYYSGAVYKSIKESLVRIVGAMIESQGTFYAKGRKKWISDVFHLYDRVVFRGEELPDGGVADTNYLFLSSWYLESLNSFYIKPLDFDYYRSLRSSLAGRLYEFLSVQFYGLKGRPYQIDYYRLCKLLPLVPQEYFSLAKQTLSGAHEELKRTKFLSKVLWEKVSGRNDQKWTITYYPGPRARKEIERLPMEEQLELELPGPDNKEETDDQTRKYAEELKARGVSDSVAADLAEKYPDRITEKLKMGDLLSKKGKIDDLAAWLVKAIKDDYQPPQEVRKQNRREEINRLVQAEVDSAMAEWDQMSPEEKVAPKITEWIKNQKRFGHEPTAEEIEKKRREEIIMLPGAEERRKLLEVSYRVAIEKTFDSRENQ